MIAVFVLLMALPVIVPVTPLNAPVPPVTLPVNVAPPLAVPICLTWELTYACNLQFVCTA